MSSVSYLVNHKQMDVSIARSTPRSSSKIFRLGPADGCAVGEDSTGN